MIALALLLAFAAPQRVLLTDDVYSIPHGQWRYLEVRLKQRVATIECSFNVVSGGPGVRVTLVSARELVLFREGGSHDVLATTDFRPSGLLRFTVPEPGEYALVVDNRAEGAARARVKLEIYLEFGGERHRAARTLPPARKWTVVVLSIGCFLLLAVWAGRRLIRAFQRSPG